MLMHAFMHAGAAAPYITGPRVLPGCRLRCSGAQAPVDVSYCLQRAVFLTITVSIMLMEHRISAKDANMLNHRLSLLAASLAMVLGSSSAMAAQENTAPAAPAAAELRAAPARPAAPAAAPAGAVAKAAAAAPAARAGGVAAPAARAGGPAASVVGAFSPEKISAGAAAAVGAPAPKRPAFTFENQSSGNKRLDLGGHHGLGTGEGTTIGVLDGNAERVQEVSVPVLTTFDNAVMDGFKSLESGITLGLGKSSKLTINDVAPALRSFTSDADGNLVLRFSIPMAESILKKEGASSWKGLSNPVLVWMAGLDGSANMSLVSGQNLTSFAQSIMAATSDYKYRLIFPILDLQEIKDIKVATVLDQDIEALTRASERYGADYFIAGSFTSVPEESNVTFKWNLYNRDGQPVSSSSVTGLMDEVSSLGAGDIARALMTWQANQDQMMTPAAMKASNVDIDMLGPGEGFVRMSISNVKSLQDVQSVRQIMVSYGFDGDIRIIGFDNGQLVLEVSTNSKAENLAATMRHAGEFQYLSPWNFSFVENAYIRPAMIERIGPASKNRPDSRINPANVAPAHVVKIRDARDVGQGNGLPNRNAPAIQGAAL